MSPFASRVLVGVLLAASVSGCLGSVKGALQHPTSVLDDVLPAGCSGNATAVLHAGDGGLAAPAAGFGCISDTGMRGGETALGVHPRSGAIYYYPAHPPNAQGQALAASSDGGKTWKPVFPNTAGVPTHPFSLDPFMYLDPATGRIFVEDIVSIPTCSLISFSDDEGATWTNSMTGCTQGDHVNIFAGKAVTSTTIGYPSVVYRCGINTVVIIYGSFSSTCQKSINGGLTWVQTGAPAYVTDPSQRGTEGVPGWCDGAVGDGAAGPDGTVYLPKGFCGTPMLSISRDEGLTWTRTKVSDLGMMVAFCNNWDHEANVQADKAGNVYYFWVDNQHVPRLAISHDHGATFAPAIDVRPPGVTQAAMPQLAMGADGKLAMLYMGSTNAPKGPFPKTTATDPQDCQTVPTSKPDPAYADVTWNAYLTLTTDALDAHPSFFSAPLNDPSQPLSKGKCDLACSSEGDFIDVQVGPDGTAWAGLESMKGEAIVGHVLDGPSLR